MSDAIHPQSSMAQLYKPGNSIKHTTILPRILTYLVGVALLYFCYAGSENAYGQSHGQDTIDELTYDVSLRDYWMDAADKTQAQTIIAGTILVRVDQVATGNEQAVVVVTSKIKSIHLHDQSTPIPEIKDEPFRCIVGKEGIISINPVDEGQAKSISDHRIFLIALNAIFPPTPPAGHRPDDVWIVAHDALKPTVYTARTGVDGVLTITGMSSMNLPFGGNVPPVSVVETVQSFVKDGVVESGLIMGTTAKEMPSFRVYTIQRQR